MTTRAATLIYIDILAAYDPETAKGIEQDYAHGIDVTDALYEALCVHDEHTAEGFIQGNAELRANTQ